MQFSFEFPRNKLEIIAICENLRERKELLQSDIPAKKVQLTYSVTVLQLKVATLPGKKTMRRSKQGGTGHLHGSVPILIFLVKASEMAKYRSHIFTFWKCDQQKIDEQIVRYARAPFEISFSFFTTFVDGQTAGRNRSDRLTTHNHNDKLLINYSFQYHLRKPSHY